MNEFPCITILMASYNGADHIGKQLDSVLGQTYTNWKLIIRDDGSTDNTKQIIDRYRETDTRITFINTESHHHGSCVNFSELFTWAKANLDLDYLMFCDQDDIWLPNKIGDSLQRMIQTEALYLDKPCLMYGRLHFMDQFDVEANQEVNITYSPNYRNMIVQNHMFGCTMMLNKKLIEIIPYIPYESENHDYWVALVASFFGECMPIMEKILLYRQHADNVTSQGESTRQRIKRYSNLSKQIKEWTSKLKMLITFYDIYKEKLSFEQNLILVSFLRSFKAFTPIKLIATIIRSKLFRITYLQTIGFIGVLIVHYRKLRAYVLHDDAFKLL